MILSNKHIAVQGDFPVNRLFDFLITGKVNEHGFIRYFGIIDKQTGQKIAATESENKRIQVTINNEMAFAAIPETIELSEHPDCFYIKLTGKTTTSGLDITPRKRFYQDTSMSYEKMLNDAYGSQGSAITATKRSIEAVKLQYLETDWQYSHRMAGDMGVVLIPNSKSSSPQVLLGIPQRKAISSHASDFSVLRRSYEDGAYATRSGFSAVGQSQCYSIIDNENIYDLGDTISFQNSQLAVMERRIELVDGYLRNHYMLGEEKAFAVKPYCNHRISGLTLEGTVTAREGHSLQLQFDIDQCDQKVWFEFAPETNNGMYLMPPIGAIASLQWQSNEDSNAIAVHCVGARTSNPMPGNSSKHLYTEYKHRLNMLPSTLGLVLKSGKMAIKNVKGVTFETSRALKIKAKKNIRLSSARYLRISATEEFIAHKSGVISGIEMSAGEVNVKSEQVHSSVNPNASPGPLPIVDTYRPTAIKLSLAARLLGMQAK